MTLNTEPWFPQDEIFELPGPEPYWMWASTCEPTCGCPEALIFATPAGRQVLRERLDDLDPSLRNGRKHHEHLLELSDLYQFRLDIETCEISLSERSQQLIERNERTEIDTISQRIIGDTLDGIDALRHMRRGRLVPELEILLAQRLEAEGAVPGNLVFWRKLCPRYRRDLYVLGNDRYEAREHYCSIPDCACGAVGVSFVTVPVAVPSGRVVVRSSGEVELVPRKTGNPDLLGELWTAFQTRNPNYMVRFARRYCFVHEAIDKIVSTEQAKSTKIGRNVLCPCGSGKKHKKCHGANHLHPQSPRCPFRPRQRIQPS